MTSGVIFAGFSFVIGYPSLLTRSPFEPSGWEVEPEEERVLPKAVDDGRISAHGVYQLRGQFHLLVGHDNQPGKTWIAEGSSGVDGIRFIGFDPSTNSAILERSNGERISVLLKDAPEAPAAVLSKAEHTRADLQEVLQAMKQPPVPAALHRALPAARRNATVMGDRGSRADMQIAHGSAAGANSGTQKDHGTSDDDLLAGVFDSAPQMRPNIPVPAGVLRALPADQRSIDNIPDAVWQKVYADYLLGKP